MIDKQKLVDYLDKQRNLCHIIAEQDTEKEPRLLSRQSVWIAKALEFEMLRGKVEHGEFDTSPTCTKTCPIHGAMDHGACESYHLDHYCVCLPCERLYAVPKAKYCRCGSYLGQYTTPMEDLALPAICALCANP